MITPPAPCRAHAQAKLAPSNTSAGFVCGNVGRPTPPEFSHSGADGRIPAWAAVDTANRVQMARFGHCLRPGLTYITLHSTPLPISSNVEVHHGGRRGRSVRSSTGARKVDRPRRLSDVDQGNERGD